MHDHSFTLHTIDTAPEGSRAVMTERRSKNGFVPNLLAAMALSPRTITAYDEACRQLESSAFSGAEQHLICLTVSCADQSPYGVAAHSQAARAAGLSPEIIAAVREDRPILDPKLAVIRDFTAKMVRNRGRVSRDDVNDFIVAGHTRDQVLDIALAIATQTLGDYVEHLTAPPLDDAFARRA
ncbi:carboxymuconolactone decarboxylase family protein [Varunaivibrio sulfuroxidans]|uniref:Putative peroxidase-related enzyme n=1 Tax=Varunaivibrio sulfuroxidans TaxID=1773489 RepID=A0A4R3JFB2_9PROT|nr:carboxymuconolactone decarboxylase family protein [Varunaivibrio sulfuroxidans]TCS64788.1 putative peroxidase-related enzyme [Varunaivibrio sulfuroxidans]WES29908.1 carboxymuconolactone decarboxylase family protein [Varunaivibrio sulfuroxidans]